MQKVITIGIPSYNRKEPIFLSVKSYCEMIKKNKLEEKVELLIIDNGSNKYDIFNLLKDFQTEENKRFLKILRNPTNIGITKNTIKTMELSSGEFYFFIGDDDLVDYNNLVKVINVVIENKDKYNVFICAQNRNYSQEMFEGIEKNKIELKKNILNIKPIYCLANAMSFAKKSCFGEFISKKRQFLEKYPIPQAALVLQNLKIKDEALLCNYNIFEELPVSTAASNNTITAWSLNFTRFAIYYFYDIEFNLDKKFFFKRHPILKTKNFLKLLIAMNLHYHYLDTEKEKNEFDQFFLENKLPFWYKILVKNTVKSKFCKYFFSFVFLIRNFIIKKEFISIKNYRKKFEVLKKRSDSHHWNKDFFDKYI